MFEGLATEWYFKTGLLNFQYITLSEVWQLDCYFNLTIFYFSGQFLPLDLDTPRPAPERGVNTRRDIQLEKIVSEYDAKGGGRERVLTQYR
jgi:hypothetical protein